MIERIGRGILFLLPPETAHWVACATLATVARAPIGRRLLEWWSGVRSGEASNRGSVRALGLEFRNRVGLAAGFDKNGEYLSFLPLLGFGFAEIGTVTLRPQGGNPRPRLFRFAAKRTLLNRMGFNNLGAELVAQNVRRARQTLPSDFRVGINLGLNKTTPAADAPTEYGALAERMAGLGDYYVVNVSSPNTPGLRDLQAPDRVAAIVSAVRAGLDRASAERANSNTAPVLVKLAPEIDGVDVFGVIWDAASAVGASGLVLTNTLASVDPEFGNGGLSGGPLTALSLDRLRTARTLSRGPEMISVGGILEPEHAVERLTSGASLVQVYTGFIFGGVSWLRRVVAASSQILDR